MAIAQKFQASLIAKGLSVQFFSGMALGKERQGLVVSLDPMKDLSFESPLPAIVWRELANSKVTNKCLVISFADNRFLSMYQIEGFYSQGTEVYPEIIDCYRNSYLSNTTLDKAVKWLS